MGEFKYTLYVNGELFAKDMILENLNFVVSKLVECCIDGVPLEIKVEQQKK